MKHFEEITPENRWKNEVLEQLRKQNELLSLLVETMKQEEKPKLKKK